MVDVARITALRDRVAGLTGPDREVDCQVAYALDYEVEGMVTPFRLYCDVHNLEWSEIARHANSHQSILHYNLPRFTATIDAALAFAKRGLPGWAYCLQEISGIPSRTEKDCVADFWLPAQKTKGLRHERFRSDADTLPIAIILATLNALIVENTDART